MSAVTAAAARLVLSIRSVTCGSGSISRWRKEAQSDAFSRHHHQRNDFLALYDVKFEAVVSSELLSSQFCRAALPTLAAVTKRSISSLGNFSLAVCASAEIFVSFAVIDAASPLSIFSDVRLAGA